MMAIFRLTFLSLISTGGNLPLAITKGQSYFLSLKKGQLHPQTCVPLFEGDFRQETVISEGEIIDEKRSKLIISTEKVISYDFGQIVIYNGKSLRTSFYSQGFSILQGDTLLFTPLKPLYNSKVSITNPKGEAYLKSKFQIRQRSKSHPPNCRTTAPNAIGAAIPHVFRMGRCFPFFIPRIVQVFSPIFVTKKATSEAKILTTDANFVMHSYFQSISTFANSYTLPTSAVPSPPTSVSLSPSRVQVYWQSVTQSNAKSMCKTLSFILYVNS